MKHIYEELVRYDEKFQQNYLDFYGDNSILSSEDRKEFLSKYSRMYKEKYGEDFAYKKVISEEESKKITNTMFAQKEKEYKAYKRNINKKFRGWNLYTKRAKISNGVVSLNDSYQFPVPCAKYEYDFQIKKINFSINIGKEYCRDMDEVIGSVATGRYIEFRRGCKEILNFIITPDGTISQKDGSVRPYHYSFNQLGKIRFCEWNDIEITFEEEKCYVKYSETVYELNYSNKEIPNTLYLGGGMQPIDSWQFKCNECIDVNGDVQGLFIKENDTNFKDEFIGYVSLPYALATEKNKDKALVLKKQFNIKGDKKSYIYIESIDPGGQVYVNNNLVVELDTFESKVVEITNFVKTCENDLEIVVNPRSPEVLYPWHRHFDYYNAWFCLNVEIFESLCKVDEPIKVITNKVLDNKQIDFSVQLETKDNFKKYTDISYDISLRKVYSISENYRSIEQGKLEGNNINRHFNMSLDAWDIDTPNLYEIKLTIYSKDKMLWENSVETGFRTIEQKKGSIYLNGKKIILKGALNMQFLPPYEEIPLNHLCPEIWQMVQQAESIKRLNGNCLRMHQLGYGNNDSRWTAVLDRLGVLTIWTTRLIESIQNLEWTKTWHQKQTFINQIKKVINSPSIIMWEGSNEVHASIEVLDRMYDNFVDAVYEVDNTRLMCPVSHLYYGGGLYGDNKVDVYYNDNGTLNESGEARSASYGWKDKNVVRSAHTYSLLLGYGTPWRYMTEQKWRWQDELFNSKEHAYIVSEFAIIGRQNPNTEEAKRFINKDSYEFGDEKNALGFIFEDFEWELSQAFQALCAGFAIRQLYKHGADGIIWCCLTSGANNASYLKPILDFYSYKKQAFYVMKEMFQDIVVFSDNPNPLICEDLKITPIIAGIKANEITQITMEIVTESNKVVFTKQFVVNEKNTKCPSIKIPKLDNGYYKMRYII